MSKSQIRFDAMAEALQSEYAATFIKTFDKDSAKRIINRCMAQGWWFAANQIEGEWHIALSSSIDLVKDLRARLPNLKFELD